MTPPVPTPVRRRLFTRFVATGLATAFLLAPALDAGAQTKETEEVNRTIPFAPGGTLKLKSFSGSVKIVGTDGGEVVVHAIRRATRDRLDRIRLDIQVSGSSITIDANKHDRSWGRDSRNNVVETDFDIRVPRRIDLDVSVFSSPVTISDVEGAHDVQSFSSDLDLRNISTPLKAKTFSGSIEVALSGSSASPDLDLDSFSGDIEVTMPGSASGELSFSSFSGDLQSDYPLTLTGRTSKRKLTAQLNAGGSNRMSFHTFSGDVRIRK